MIKVNKVKMFNYLTLSNFRKLVVGLSGPLLRIFDALAMFLLPNISTVHNYQQQIGM